MAGMTNKDDGPAAPGAPMAPATLADIEQRGPEGREIWYGHSILTSTLFPPTPPAAGTDFVSKSNGSIEYVLEAGIDPEDRRRKFPYGKYPRLIMAWIAKQIRSAGGRRTAFVDPETRTITIPSIWQLCRELGLPTGGKTAAKIQEQLRLLLASHISIRRTTGFKGRRLHDMVSLPLVEAVRFAEDDDSPSLSGSAFVLTREVYERLARESAPFDTRATSYLLSGRSVLPYDVYVWLAGSMKSLRHDLPVGWDWLYERFGDGISIEHNFRTVFKRAIRKVQQVYPDARVTVNRNGLILHPSPTAIDGHVRRDDKALDRPPWP